MKAMCLPSVERATKGAINTCYGYLIASDSRWITGLPQFNEQLLRQRRKPIQFIYSRTAPRLRAS